MCVRIVYVLSPWRRNDGSGSSFQETCTGEELEDGESCTEWTDTPTSRRDSAGYVPGRSFWLSANPSSREGIRKRPFESRGRTKTTLENTRRIASTFVTQIHPRRSVDRLALWRCFLFLPTESLLCLLWGQDLGSREAGLQVHHVQTARAQEVPQTLQASVRIRTREDDATFA